MRKKRVFVILFIIYVIVLNAQSYNGEPILNISFETPAIDKDIDEKLLDPGVIRNKFEKIFRENTKHDKIIVYRK